MPWIYRYLNGAREKVDSDFHDTEALAIAARDEHRGFGAIVAEVVEVDTSYELRQE